MAKTVDVTIRGKNETKPAFDDAERQAKGFGERFKTGILTPMTAIKTAVVGIAAGIVGQFAKASVESAATAEAAWGRVEVAVSNAGITFKNVQGDLDKLFTKLQETTRYSDDDAASAFATLVTISGDYAGSLKNLTLAADIAAQKQIDIGEAAQIVGKVMAGETGMLKRYGIVVKEGADAMQALRDKFHGFAEKDAGTLSGRLAAVANAWDNVKEAIGRALLGGDAMKGQTNAIAESLNKLGKWIDDNSEGIHTLVAELGKLVEYLLNIPEAVSRIERMPGVRWAYMLVNRGRSPEDDHPNGAAHFEPYGPSTSLSPAAQEEIRKNAERARAEKAARDAAAADKAQDKRISDLKQEAELLLKARDIIGLTTKDYERLATIEGELKAIVANTNEPLRVRAAAAEILAKEAQRQRDLEEKSALLDRDLGASTARALPVQIVKPRGAPIDIHATAAALPGEVPHDFGRDVRSGVDEATEAFKDLDTSIEGVGRTLGKVTGGALTEFVSTWTAGLEDVIAGHEALGTAIVKSVRKAVGGSLLAEGQRTLLKAAEAAAEGFTNPVKLLQAAKLFGVGSAEIAAGALFSGGGGGGSYGGGGGLSYAGFQQSQSDVAGKGKLTVIFPGKKSVLDPNDPDDLNALREMFEHLAGTRQIEFIVGS